MVGVAWLLLLDSRLSVHNPFVLRMPLYRIWSARVMSTLSFLNVTLHPLSQRTPTDSNEWLANAGNMCPVVAAAGNNGKFSWHVCVELIWLPSGSLTVTGFRVGFLAVAGVLSIR